jgi:hypothetical protein
MDESFTYMICSDDRKNTTLPSAGQPIFYDIDFGGFSEQYDNYMCEVISLGISDGILSNARYLMFACENLANNGYFCRGKLASNDVILSIVPTSALGDVLVQSDGGNAKFRVNNCRMLKQVTFYFLRPDFTPAIVGTDLNVGGTESKWVLNLRMYPIK